MEAFIDKYDVLLTYPLSRSVQVHTLSPVVLHRNFTPACLPSFILTLTGGISTGACIQLRVGGSCSERLNIGSSGRCAALQWL